MSNKTQPTYSATEIKKLCATIEVDYDGFKAIQEIVEEELELYSQEDLVILFEASMIMFTRCMMFVSVIYMKPPPFERGGR